MRRMLPLLCCVFVCTVVSAQKDCRYPEHAERIISENPDLISRIASIEAFTYSHSGDRRIAMAGTTGVAALPGVITIPVVVHIVYNNDAQNLSDKQVLSQIEALNKDFRNLNADRANVPAYFKDLMADCGIEFKLALQDPRGVSTSGIVRRKTMISNFGMDDRVKYTSQGGDDAWDASRYLNIWVCNLAGGVVGYSSIIGGPADKDGVVISSFAFGISSRNNGNYNKGRTATHEIGHWLNLRHIWGDTYCGDDKVDDTPSQRSPTRGCPSGKNMSCGTTANGDMYMNFMDLTNDACMHMFTYGQRERMRTLFMSGGIRSSLLTSDALTPSLISEAPVLPDNNTGADNGITIYPNPASLSINIQFNNLPENESSFIIFNAMGQAVQRYTIKGKQQAIDISHLKNGIYYLKPASGNPTMMKKFIKAG